LRQSAKRAAILTSFLVASPLFLQAQVLFSPPANISNDGHSGDQQIAIDPSGNISVVWLDSTPGYYAVFFSRSSDGGATFSSPQNLSTDPNGSLAPQIAVDPSGGINVVWEDSTSPNDIFFSRSSDGGATFSTPKNISNNPAGANNPYLAVDSGGNINVVWVGSPRTAPSIIFFSRSSDGGATFSTPIAVSTNPSHGPLVAVDFAGNINVTWIEGLDGPFHAAFSRSSDGGATFTAPKQISGLSEVDPGPRMALDSKGNIYVVWYTTPNGNIYLSYSSDGGATFSNTNITNYSGFPAPSPSAPQIAIDSGGNINVAWEDNRSGPLDIFFSHSSDGGATFPTSQNLSNMGGAGDPQIATGLNGSINIVWQDSAPGNSQVFFTQSSDGGATFSVPQNLSNDSGNSQGPMIAMDPTSNANVLWIDNTPGNNDVFFSRSEPPPTLISLALSPATVTGSSSSTGTVTLNTGAPSGGVVVSLSSTDAGVAAVPDSVTVPAGSTNATFTATTTPVNTSAPVTISGSYNGSTETATLTVTPPILTSLTLNPSTVIGGPLGSSTGTVTLSVPAAVGGAQVALSSSNQSVASLPGSVTVPAGSTSATFTVSTSIVLVYSSVTISSSYNNTTQSGNLAVLF
jgi:hypothetical protein